MKCLKCPTCKSAEILWKEIAYSLVEWSQNEDGEIDSDYVHDPQPGKGIWGECQNCSRVWQPRKNGRRMSLDNLPNIEAYREKREVHVSSYVPLPLPLDHNGEDTDMIVEL